MDKRFRRFRIETEWLDQGPDVVAKFMEGMIATRAECLYADNCIEYDAWHPDFNLMAPDDPIELFELELVIEPKVGPDKVMREQVTGIRFKDSDEAIRPPRPELVN